MRLAQLLGPLSPRTFFSEHYLRRPLLVRGTAAALRPLADPERVNAIALSGCDLLLVKDGALWKGDAPHDAQALAQRHAEGFTLVLRRPEPFDDALAGLSRTFAAEVGGDINLHLYRTPAGARGFDWHCDPEEVFFLQTHGHKRFWVRENTLHPAPLLETLAAAPDPSRETSVAEAFDLHPGDWLYVPGGAWHRAEAVGAEDSTSVSVGVMAPTALDALEHARRRLLADPRWRARLPPLGRASPLGDAEKVEVCRAAFTALGEALAEVLRSESLPMEVMVERALARMRVGRG
jgi:50S ribosomal protein L16 3-hydroxylase